MRWCLRCGSWLREVVRVKVSAAIAHETMKTAHMIRHICHMHTHTHTHTHRHTHTDTQTHSDRQTDTDRQTQTDRHRHRQTDTHMW